MEPHSITAVHPIWRPGDVVLDGNSNVRVRSDNPRRPWGYPGEGDTLDRFGNPYGGEGGLDEEDVPCPRRLLVRAGKIPDSPVVEE